MNDELFQRVLERVRAIFSGIRGGHDLDHTMRVYVNACKIADMELPAEDQEKIFYRNAEKLLNIRV